MNGRKHTRAELERHCHLIGRDGEDCQASLVNISLGGAMVSVVSKTQLKIGDFCDLMLSLKSAELPIKRACEIVRLDNEIIGVKFLT